MTRQSVRHATTTTRVTDLAWKLLDEIATPGDVKQLETLLLTSASLMKTYIEVISFAESLREHFRTKPA